MPLLTPEDHAFFDENGYVLIPGVISKADCDAVIAATWEFFEMENSPENWYKDPVSPGSMIELYQHQALWNNRQNPTLYQAFSEILGEEKLWVSLDRVNFKPPVHPDHPEFDRALRIHWDADTSTDPLPTGVQGLVYLADTTEDQGGFRCVPEIFKNFSEWVKGQPADRNPRWPVLTDEKVVPIPGKAGDVVIWHKMLAHGNGRNLSQQPRYAQFITMYPEKNGLMGQREERIRWWQERTNPVREYFPGDPRQWEQKHGKTAELTPLGRKLLGVDPWE